MEAETRDLIWSCTGITLPSCRILPRQKLTVKCLADRGSERPTTGDVLWHLELAWQQQMKAAANAETRTCANVFAEAGAEEFSLTINDDGPCGHDIGNLDPTPGAEFSELVSKDFNSTSS
ncbi:malectin/receptor-like protein kinase family protein [Actinidia rufa]|uniref:Malectin/receptor-like protein kinase family protein n=1 Tax=Actinidia rufa TaxID=165716 RepID=A0A7J0G9Z8_9ERIC|nr:malectin/receptor-like protein kinase family protein [Actinidia rufa]